MKGCSCHTHELRAPCKELFEEKILLIQCSEEDQEGKVQKTIQTTFVKPQTSVTEVVRSSRL